MKKHETAFKYNPELHEALVRASICTGEKAAGFRNKTDGRFYEVMLIRTPDDLEAFKKTYGLTAVKTEY